MRWSQWRRVVIKKKIIVLHTPQLGVGQRENGTVAYILTYFNEYCLYPCNENSSLLVCSNSVQRRRHVNIRDVTSSNAQKYLKHFPI